MISHLLPMLIGAPTTLALTAVAFAGGALLGIPFCIMRLSTVAAARVAAQALILVFRAIPPIVWLFFVFFGMGSGYLEVGPFPSAAIGLGLITAANMAEIYRGALSSIHVGQWEASMALNLSSLHAMRDVIAPQVFRVALPSAATLSIGLLKDTAVASTVGVHDIAFEVYHLSQESFSGLDVYAAAALLYILISLPIAFVARWTDRRLRAAVSR